MRSIAAVVATLAFGIAAACAPPLPPPGQFDALTVLASIPLELENWAGYNRDLFGYPADADGDHCDTRADVLLRDTTAPVSATPGCTIVSGQWFSAYDGQTVTNAADVEIDHVVALKEAWDSGAFAWDDARRAAYGNDLSDPPTLAAVTASSEV